MMGLIKRWVRGLLSGGRLFVGYLKYLLSGQTPAYAYQSMISLFCLTRGHSSDLISNVIGFFRRPYRFAEANGALGDMADDQRRAQVLSVLREQGYYVFENRLPEDVCDRLLQYATTQPCLMRPTDGHESTKPAEAVYHREHPQAVRYEFRTQDLLDNPDVQKLLGDLSFAALAQDYFGSRPILDVLGTWWHTALLDQPDKEAAQFYHFDMDRLKWLKFFIYLTDVKPENGPHTFIAGSHRTGGIPDALLRKEYARLTDEEVHSVYEKSDVIEFTAPRGTIIAEDTRGLHKGKHVETGDRLILQIQFSNSLFGAYYPKTRLGGGVVPELQENIKKYPEMYAAYL